MKENLRGMRMNMVGIRMTVKERCLESRRGRRAPEIPQTWREGSIYPSSLRFMGHG